MGKDGGAGRAFEKRERPVLGGCRVVGPIMAPVDSASPRLNNKAEAMSLAGWSYTDRVRCRVLGVVLLAVLRHASEGPHLVSHIDGAG